MRAAGLALLLAVLPVTPARADGAPKRFYLAVDDHTDYMWSATDTQYRSAFLAMLDYYMDQAEATAGNPPDQRGRFNCDASLYVWEYEKNRSAAGFQRLIDHLRDESITMPLNTSVQLYGAMPAEAVLRGMYYAGRLERRENLRFPLVVPQENQVLSGGVASLWAGAGALYSWKGVCHCASQIESGNRPRDMYRFTGPDGQSVLMKWNNYNGHHSLGGYLEAVDPNTVVPYMDGDAGFLARWPWPVAAAFGYGGDNIQTTTDAIIQASQQLSTANRRVIVSNELDFFRDFVANYGDQLTSFSGCFGNEWDLYTASMGEVTAAFKRGVEKLRTAEALATIAALDDPSFLAGREALRDSAFLACGLYYEHDWTGDGTVTKSARAQWQRQMLTALTRYVDPLHADGLARLGQRVANPGGAERHVVFNPLSWSRTDFADLSVATPAPYRVVDVVTGLEVASEPRTVNGGPGARILAADVPSLGYRVYEIQPGSGAAFPPSATVTLPTFENALYRVTLGTRGQITSVLDKKDANRQLVASGQALNDIGSATGSVVLESTGPVSTTLRVTANGTPQHQARVTLYAGIDRIDVDDRVTQNFGNDLFYVSSFDLPGALTRHEEVGMIARAARQSAGGDYADQNARTDYLTFNHFVDLSQSGRGVTMSNWDSPYFRLGNSTPTTLDATSTTIRAVVGMQVDGPTFGIQNQGGDTFFLDRFALRTHGAFDQAAAMRMALEHQNPLVAARLTGNASGPLPATTWSLVSIDSPDVLLWALKSAEEGIASGLIARVWNLADAPRTFALALPNLGIGMASRTSHIETDGAAMTLQAGALTDGLQRQEMRSYRLQPGSVAAVPERGAEASGFEVYPNPGSALASRTLGFTLPRAGRMRIEVYDHRGARVALVANAFRPAGRGFVTWSGRGERGPLPAGVYFARLTAGGLVRTRRIAVLP